MSKTNLDEAYLFEFSIKMRFLRVLVTIQPGRS